MNEPFDFDEAQIAAALQASVKSEPVNLVPFDQLVARSSRSGQRNAFTIGGAVVLAAAAAGAGVLVLRQNTDDQATRLELGTRGGSSSSLIANSSQSSSSVATDSSSSAIAVAADPSSSVSSSSVPTATIAGEREYILAVLDGRVAILNRQGNLVRDYGETGAHKVQFSQGKSEAWIMEKASCDGAEIGRLRTLDLASGAFVTIKEEENFEFSGISPDGKVLAGTGGCGGALFFRLDQPGIPEVEVIDPASGYPTMFSFTMMDDGASAGRTIARTDQSAEQCEASFRYRDAAGDPDRFFDMIRNAADPAGPCVDPLADYDRTTGSRLEGEHLRRVDNRIELRLADGGSVRITQDRSIIDAEFIPAGTDLGVLQPVK